MRLKSQSVGLVLNWDQKRIFLSFSCMCNSAPQCCKGWSSWQWAAREVQWERAAWASQWGGRCGIYSQTLYLGLFVFFSPSHILFWTYYSITGGSGRQWSWGRRWGGGGGWRGRDGSCGELRWLRLWAGWERCCLFFIPVGHQVCFTRIS